MLLDNHTESIRLSTWRFWVRVSFLFITAVALRWVRLDLMTFRYDQAEAAFRAMDAFKGNFPFTGIVNSMGFENAPGYIWSILPAFLFSSDPQWATAWHGLLASTMIFPLALLGRRYRSDALLWLPAVLAATLPVAVFGGRNLWSLHLLPAVTAWALLALDTAMDDTREWRRRRRAGGFMLALWAWGISIHFSAAPLALIATGFLLAAFRIRLKYLAPALIPAAVIFATMIPSGIDWWARTRNPAPKADYVQDFEGILPDPLPWYERVPDSAMASVFHSTSEALWGIQSQVSKGAFAVVRGYDFLVLIIVLASGGYALFRVLRKTNQPVSEPQQRLCVVLISCLILPAVLAGLLVPRVNANYFLGSLPVGWLLPLILPGTNSKGRRLALPLVLGMLAAGLVCIGIVMTSIARHNLIPGPYYITYGMHAQALEHIRSKGVVPGRIRHLSGGWFQHSYDYIHRYVGNGVTTRSQGGAAFALIEDKNLWPEKPEKLQVFWRENPAEFGEVGVLVFPSRGAAETFINRYYETSKN